MSDEVREIFARVVFVQAETQTNVCRLYRANQAIKPSHKETIKKANLTDSQNKLGKMTPQIIRQCIPDNYFRPATIIMLRDLRFSQLISGFCFQYIVMLPLAKKSTLYSHKTQPQNY